MRPEPPKAGLTDERRGEHRDRCVAFTVTFEPTATPDTSATALAGGISDENRRRMIVLRVAAAGG